MAPGVSDPALATEVVARLAGGRPLDGLDLATVAGRVDLRDLDAPGLVAGGPEGVVEITGATVADLDLRGARLAAWRFQDCELRNCLLDGANCADWRLWATRVEDCSFQGADLSGAAIGTWHEGRGNQWRRVDFRAADLKVTVCWTARFEDCDFSGADLAGTRFQQCALVRCRFAGPLIGVVFDGRPDDGRPASPPLEGVDLSAAQFEEVSFLGFDLDGVRLPDDPDLRVVADMPCTVERAFELLDGLDHEGVPILRADLEARLVPLRHGSGPHDAGVLNRRDYLRYGGPDLADLAFELFGRAEADCRQRSEP